MSIVRTIRLSYLLRVLLAMLAGIYSIWKIREAGTLKGMEQFMRVCITVICLVYAIYYSTKIRKTKQQI
jgi:hypothetical protein